MKKLMILAAMLAMVLVVAAPALADSRGHNHHHFFNDNGAFQESEQDADSGDVDQSVNVSQTGDNSNQCVGINGIANTGNPQDQTDLIQFGSLADDFEFDDTGANLTVTGNGSTTCDQQVNQAAAAG